MSMRSTASNIGAGELNETYAIDGSTIVYDSTAPNGSADVGKAVTLTGNDIVGLATDGSAIVGKLIIVESDGFCSVQVRGNLTLPGGDGATLTRGLAIVGDLGPSSAKGYIRAANSAVAAELAVARGQITNIADTTEVVVRL